LLQVNNFNQLLLCCTVRLASNYPGFQVSAQLNKMCWTIQLTIATKTKRYCNITESSQSQIQSTN